MLLTVYCVRRDLSEVTFSLQVDADFELHNFRALCELESGIPAAESQIVYAERPLTDNHRSLASYGLKDGDVVILRQKETADPRPPAQFPKKFSRVLVEQQQDRARREQERIRLFSADPFDLEAQAKIEEDIRQQNIEENMTIAMEEAPESFGQVVMLYINCKVNGHPVKAFVDSGAQMTIMSQACAERCNIMRLVDRRWAGIAKGVGTQKIIGRVHLAQVQIEGDFLACSFSILEEQPMDMLLGLDMLKRHQCSIDLKKNVLVIGTTGSQTTFLPEGELPECARLAYGAGREEMRPEEIADRELAEALQKSIQDAEKSGEETTSLGMSSLPTSDGCDHPAHPSGQSPETGDPAGLARSVSAPVGPVKPSDPGSIQPTAGKASNSAEFQTASEKKEHLPPQDLAGHAPSADSALAARSPATHVQNSPGEAAVADHPGKSHLHTGQEVPVTTTGVQETQRFLGEEGWPPACEDPSPVTGLQQHKEPGNQQHEVVPQNMPHDQEHLCVTGGVDLLGERQQNQPKSVDAEAAAKGGGLQQNVDLPCTRRNSPPSECYDCSDSETLMEVDTVEQSLVAVLNSAGGQNASVKNISASDSTLDNPSMEVEPSKCNTSPEILSNSIPTQNPQFPGCNAEMSGINKECGNCSPSVSPCGSCQPCVEATEGSCSSITAALKELHGLLVTNSKPASENTSEEVTCQSKTVTEGQTGFGVFPERWIQNEQLIATQNEQCSQVSFHQAISASMKTEKLTDTSTGSGIEDVESANFRGPGDGLSTDKKGVPESRESVNESSSVTLASDKTSNQLHCTLGVEISPRLAAGEGEALSQTLEQTKSWSSDFILVKDLGQGTQNPVTGRPETRDVCPEATGPLLESEPPTSCPSSSPSMLPSFVFPAADIDRILRAGFTLQEALGALRRVDGNADLALLILLAKNIVVPT
ncbi:protein DDI1 homolog 2 isoform X2 [Artibeus jamaicensis]|uniref:protein DDI1 homolog 2 isoform X2 n=1 Tax=Artibeus jamaicensis TaxID=9417 RepID=UPI00235B0630|nr:protein DDI1 homolog 2 isoform X2 [Artibeus jamaicensis]